MSQKSLADVTRDISNAMADINSDSNAYEAEGSILTTSSVAAALQSIEAKFRTGRSSSEETPKGEEAEDFYAEAPEESPFDSPETRIKGETPTPEDELEFFRQMDINTDAQDPEDKDPITGLYWGGMSNAILKPQIPEAYDDRYEYKGTVYAFKELKSIYETFQDSVRTGEPQIVLLESGQYTTEMIEGEWSLHDFSKDYWYRLRTVNDGEGNDMEDTFFIWLTEGNSDDQKSLGYIDHQWVFTRVRNQLN